MHPSRKPRAIAFTLAKHLLRCKQCAGKAHANLPLRRREIAIARTHREPIRIADCGTHPNFAGNIQVGYHLANNSHLLEILLPEVTDVGASHVQQLQHDGRDSPKMRRPRGTLPAPGDRRRVDIRGKTRRINFFLPGNQHGIDSLSRKQFQIFAQSAGIFGQIFRRRKLSWIDKNSGDDPVAINSRGFDQTQMPGMQRAHRRDHANFLTRHTPLANQFSQPIHPTMTEHL